jgi:DNA-binding MarR family transcriptional regulator
LAWYGSVSAVLRGLLRLKQSGPTPEVADELISRLNESYGLEGGPFLNLVALRQGGKADVEALADALVERLSRLVEIVDRMEAEGA